MKVIILVIGLAGLVFSQSAIAYKSADTRKIAAPSDTPISLLLGYNSRTGEYVEQCLKPVKQKRTGQSPKANADFKLVSSMSELTKDRQFDLATSMSVDLKIASASASVDVSFENKMRSKVESKAAYARFYDLAAPVFVAPNAKFQLNKRGQDALQAVSRGNVKRFERECGDSVIIGTQKGRSFMGVGTVSNLSSFSSENRDAKIRVAAKAIAAKMSTEVKMSKAESNASKELNLEISYTMSGDTRIRGATSIRKLRNAFEEFQSRPHSETQTFQYLYVIDIGSLVDKSELNFGLSTQQARKVRTILDGVGVIASAKNTAQIDKRRKAKLGSGIRQQDIENSLNALNREYSYLIGKLRESKGCLRAWTKECVNLYARFSNYPNIDRKNWTRPFVLAAYRSPKVCKSGFAVSAPSGKRLCRKCPLGKEPTFVKGKEATCTYIVQAKPKPKFKRLWAHDLKIASAKGSDSGSAADVYPDFCNGKNKGCGQKAANRLCREERAGARWKVQKMGLGLKESYPQCALCNPLCQRQELSSQQRQFHRQQVPNFQIYRLRHNQIAARPFLIIYT